MAKTLLKHIVLATGTYALVGFAVFGPYINNPFLMDDEIQVTHNPQIQDISHWPSYFTSSTMDSGGSGKMSGIYFKPFMTLYYATVWHFFGDDPAAFRLPLLLCHLMSSIMIFIFLIRFFDWRLAYLAGLLFVVHPSNAEIVAYIADAQDALYMVFGLLALTISTYERRKWLSGVLTGSLLLAGVLSKETGALFLAIVPMAAFYFERARFRFSLLTSFVVGLVYAALRIHSGLLTYEHKLLLIQQATYFERLQTVPLIVWHYIEVFFYPLRISLVNDFVVRDLSLTQFWLPILGVILFFVALRYLWLALRTDMDRKVFEFSIGVLFLWFTLHGSVVLPLDGTYGDRWFYLGIWALLTLTALALKTHLESLNPAKTKGAYITVVLVGVCLVSAASARTIVRLRDWEVPLSLYMRELDQRPFDALMANNVGFELFHRDDVRQAEIYFDRATKSNPVWDVAWNNLGACAQRLREDDRALMLYEKSVSLGSYSLAYENYAALLCSRKIDDRCTGFLKRALAIFPLNPSLQKIDAAVRQKPADVPSQPPMAK